MHGLNCNNNSLVVDGKEILLTSEQKSQKKYKQEKEMSRVDRSHTHTHTHTHTQAELIKLGEWGGRKREFIR